MRTAAALGARSRRASRKIVAAVILTSAWLGGAAELAAHPPYDYLARVVTDDEERSLYLRKSYVDGIFLTDPVRLVVQDEDGRTIASTDYGRDLIILCLRLPECLVFRYDGLLPVLPEGIWSLQGGQLRPADSVRLVALGVVAPLWTHPGGYLFASLALGCPILLLCLLAAPARSERSGVALGVAGAALVPYLGLWLYVLVLLSRLSLPLVLAVCGVAALLLLALARSARRAGAPATAVARITRGAAGLGASLGAILLALGLLLLAVWLGCSQVRPFATEAQPSRSTAVRSAR